VPDQDSELTQMQAASIRALASPNRLRIVQLLRTGPHEVNEIARHLGAAQATVSQHLALMRAAGLVEANRDGRLVRYRLADPEIGDACDVMRRTIARRHAVDPRAPGDAIDATPAQVTHA
jgi:DNA-binding transcriptional ArsR family regulator